MKKPILLWLDRLRQGWRFLWGPSLPPIPYRIDCACGRALTGWRQSRAQRVPCPGCGVPVFVLARSPLPPPDSEPPPVPRPTVSPWLMPAGAAVVTLVVVVGLLIWLVSLFSRPTSPRTQPTPVTADAIRQRASRGQTLLAEGNFREAHRHYREAEGLRAEAPDLLPPRELRAFQQQFRQADLLAHLLLQPLEDVVRHGQQSRRPEEWQGRFEEFRGRSVFFDDMVLRDGQGFQLATYQVRSAGEVARVELDLAILRRLAPHLPRRLLFGARLVSVNRDREGTWVIRFDPQSGVLLTDEGAAAGCGLPLDQELKALLRWQSEWVENNP